MRADSEKGARTTRSALDTPVRYVHGVGEARARLLEKLGIRSVADLLFHVPRRYEDRRRMLPIAEVQPGETVVISAVVVSCNAGMYRSGKTFFEALLRDESGAIRARWYNAAYLQEHIRPGDHLVVHGRVLLLEGSRYSQLLLVMVMLPLMVLLLE